MQSATISAKPPRPLLIATLAGGSVLLWVIVYLYGHGLLRPPIGEPREGVATPLAMPATLPRDPAAQGWFAPVFANAPASAAERARRTLEAAGLSLHGADLVRALDIGHQPLALCFLEAGGNVNEPDATGRTALLAALTHKQWDMAARLIAAGAKSNMADASGLTPLMAAAAAGHLPSIRLLLTSGANVSALDAEGRLPLQYAIAGRSLDAVKALLDAGAPATGAAVLEAALATNDWRCIEPILSRQPGNLTWTSATRAALLEAINRRDVARTKLLLAKHPAAPTYEGRPQPILAHATAVNDLELFRFLLTCGANPDTYLQSPVDPAFSQFISGKYLRHYLETEPGMTVLMLAAGLGRYDFVKALKDHGAKTGLGSGKHKIPAVVFAAQAGANDVAQLLIGDCPRPDQLRIEISLASQSARLIENGATVFTTEVSTGRSGFATPAGEYIVTDKHSSHTSTIYKVKMPFFMRFSYKDFGMHQGVVPGYPASHGCVRVPSGTAQKLFREVPVGTLVTIR